MYAPFPTTAQEHLKRIFPRLTVLPSPPKFTPAKPLMLPAPAAPVALLPARVSGIRQRDTLTHIERVTKRQRHKIIPKKMRPLSSDHEFTFGRTAGGQSITLHENLHRDLRADFVLANPPFNMSDWGGNLLDDDPRWLFETPPTGNANFAWVQHMIYHLSATGRAGFVLSNGSMSTNTRGGR